MKRILGVFGALALCGAVAIAQGQRRPASPAGTAATEVGGHFVKQGDEQVYQGGKWIEIASGRPIKRGRSLWGSGTDYGKELNGGAPVWRAGANVSTRLKTEVPLVINNKTVAPGEYSLFIDLKPSSWTLIVSNWGARPRPDTSDKQALWGSYDYTPDKDVVRAPMTSATLPVAIDQLTWEFVDMTDAGGKIAIMWDKHLATVPFTIGS